METDNLSLKLALDAIRADERARVVKKINERLQSLSSADESARSHLENLRDEIL
jgi:demethoxyubiquinone hydroxylase (CLK1/Coq7/Cat5 family)